MLGKLKLNFMTALLIALAVTLNACGGAAQPAASGGSSGSDANAGAATGKVDGQGGQITILMPSTSNNYLAEWAKGAKEQAESANYKLKMIENKFDAAEQDVQVQQQLASSDNSVAYIWWPADNKAGVASLRRLINSKVPVFQTNILPADEMTKEIVAYAGVNDILNGKVSGELLKKARDASVAMGNKLHSEGGNVIIIKFVAGYKAGDDREVGFKEATKDKPFNILASEYSGFDNTSGYNTMSQLIPKFRDQGIDFVYANNDALASGIIQALKEAGYKPGKDVMVVGGTCHGDISALNAAEQYGSGLQAARFEGRFSVDVVARYFANGKKVQDGEYAAPDTPDKQPDVSGAPYKFNFIPNPAVELGTDPAKAAETIKNTKLWGISFTDLCTY
ncbi:MAG: sugar ABC transporter substrate-binding protein [Anaerolineae bacterium]